jgi:hypothetical protein
MTYITDNNRNKLDNASTDGLGGVADSLAYRVEEIEKHFHNRERWLGAAIEDGGYEIAGTTSPDFDGSYYAVGVLNAKTSYANKDGNGTLWWDGVDTWVISAAEGVTGTDYFSYTNATPDGSYTNQGAATGTVTAADITDDYHVADLISIGTLSAFQLDAGNDDWGAWVQILGSEDTPAITGSAKFDLHELEIVDAENTDTVHFIQLAYGDTDGDTALAAGDYTELAYTSATQVSNQSPIYVRIPRIAVGTKVWARVMAIGENTSTIDFYIGLHEYNG